GGLDWIYLYTASGERVATLMPSSQPVIRWTDRDLGQRVLSEHVQVGSVGAPGATFSTKRYVWAGGRLLASDGPDGVRHYHPDQLGNLRLATDSAGVVAFGMGFLPFGEPADSIDSSEIHHFTGHERDHPTGLDYMHARFYSQNQGRFLSVDQLRGTPSSPQSLNRYAYALGSPLGQVDPDGRESVGIMLDNDIRDFLDGRITEQQYLDRIQGRGMVALPFIVLAIPGAPAVVTGPLGQRALLYLAVEGSPGAVAGFNGYYFDSVLNGRSPTVQGGIAAGVAGAAPGLLTPGTGPGELAAQAVVGIAAGEVADSMFDGTSSAADDADEQSNQENTYGETITVVGEDPGIVYASQELVCNPAGCFQVTISGADLEEVSRQARRIAEEAQVVGGLNELLQGACQLNGGMVCALHSGGGGGGRTQPWHVVYHY
ncbi:MAG: RHS repeat-associated core domain-containing protein, partial [Acidobacteriota bacterium]